MEKGKQYNSRIDNLAKLINKKVLNMVKKFKCHPDVVWQDLDFAIGREGEKNEKDM